MIRGVVFEKVINLLLALFPYLCAIIVVRMIGFLEFYPPLTIGVQQIV